MVRRGPSRGLTANLRNARAVRSVAAGAVIVQGESAGLDFCAEAMALESTRDLFCCPWFLVGDNGWVWTIRSTASSGGS
jgi:hypothetical protein